MPPGTVEIARSPTGPGAPFEPELETVRGLPMRSFGRRECSLREKVAQAGRRGAADFLVDGGRRISYERFARLVRGAAEALQRRHGLRRGDRLAILSYHCPDRVVALFAAAPVGGIGVGLNGCWSTDELAYGLEGSGSRYVGVDERLYPRADLVPPRVASYDRSSLRAIFHRKIVDESGREHATGGLGELRIHGPTVTPGGDGWTTREPR